MLKVLIVQDRVETLLRVSVGLLLVVLLSQFVLTYMGEDVNDNKAGLNGDEFVTLLNTPEALSYLEDYQQAVSRSLFSPDRKPKSSPSLSAPDTVKPSERWELSGIITSGAETYAILRERRGDQTIRVSQGMYVEQWRVENISADRIVLSADNEEDLLRLATATRKDAKRNVQRKASTRTTETLRGRGNTQIPTAPTSVKDSLKN